MEDETSKYNFFSLCFFSISINKPQNLQEEQSFSQLNSSSSTKHTFTKTSFLKAHPEITQTVQQNALIPVNIAVPFTNIVCIELAVVWRPSRWPQISEVGLSYK
jgi:hypothetical protein